MSNSVICLGWGSLIWDSRELSLPENVWKTDGPSLPVEFVRFSKDGRVTLVVDQNSQLVPVLWARMQVTDLDDAIIKLAHREGTNPKSIHSVTRNDVDHSSRIHKIICDWMKNIDADSVIWTGLSYSKGYRPTEDEVISHISDSNEETKRKIKEYILNAPQQIDTEYRRKIVRHFGW